jgi:hypothetical protein
MGVEILNRVQRLSESYASAGNIASIEAALYFQQFAKEPELTAGEIFAVKVRRSILSFLRIHFLIGFNDFLSGFTARLTRPEYVRILSCELVNCVLSDTLVRCVNTPLGATRKHTGRS